VYFGADEVHSAKPLYFFLERYVESFIAEMKEFVGSILEDTSPRVAGLDGRIPVMPLPLSW
jgi:myo-inositol 2-dehydrogenase / D-chiro-inositol 1-dehydrogenase